MSRTRNRHKQVRLWLFKSTTTDVLNNITNGVSSIGQSFYAQEDGERLKETYDAISGRVIQSTTVTKYTTQSQLKFEVGDVISTIENPTQLNLSMIQRVSGVIINKRQLHNREPIRKYTIEVS